MEPEPGGQCPRQPPNKLGMLRGCRTPLFQTLLAAGLLCMLFAPDRTIPSLHLIPKYFRAREAASRITPESRFGASSSVECIGDVQQTCVFKNLYLSNGQLFFVYEDAGAQSRAKIGDIHLGVPLHSDNPWPAIQPVGILSKHFVQRFGGGGSIYEPPVFLYHRLNPNNIYHHLWDDMSTLFALLLEVFPAQFRLPGEPSSIQIVFTDGFGRNKHIDIWGAVTDLPVLMYPEIFRNEAAVVMFRAVGAGSRGRCTHRRHCTADMPVHLIQAFKRHMLAFYEISAKLPDHPTAVVIAREGRRILKNIDEVADMARNLGYTTHVVGPFGSLPLRAQLQMLANASLAIFLHGAELGIAWLGLPEGACASVIFPFYFTDTISWWVGEKVGLKIAPFYDMPSSKEDHRLRKPIRNIDESVALYNEDIWVAPWLLEHSMWCANHPGFASTAG